ncbi:threonine ammonia-lyase, biosynthetic [Actinomyces glycerinitolerans]|uniref:L-threonine dehydratase n=1 Tax=Actinomyces glycerinitolerans TaxID=1892869 RepID=A0A1M4RXR9_9ACTO|nr:threonine ammonia-lyase, biosynthetic [Actinomyces glycerinitolerans]SHE24700.1 serine/threonine dehydratases pyridoxal-phosphate attachment site [Actinomyces glycerinitolerans]
MSDAGSNGNHADPDSPWDGARYLREILRAPVYEAAEHTPLQPMPALSTRLGNTVEVKREDLQSVHSFKIRGAYNAMRSLSDAERERGVVTASAGNHAQGVARSASLLGVRALIVMPTVTPRIKVDAVRTLGGEVLLSGDNFDAAKAEALRLAKAEGLTYIAPFDDPRVIAGQGTIGLEMIQQDADLDRVFVPVGGGGLVSGIAVLIKQLMPQVQVIGVEHEESACLNAALAAGEPVTLEHVGLFAEGVAVRRIGDETFRLCAQLLDDVVTVSSDEVSAAVRDLFEDLRAVPEPSGAVALAGLKQYVAAHDLSGERLACVLSGANLNFHQLRYISERAEIGEQREAILGVTIPEVQGEFLRFASVLGGRAVTEFNYRVSASAPAGAPARIFVGVRLTRGRDERREIVADLEAAGYGVVDLTEDELAKVHVRSMIGGRAPEGLVERLFSFEFPESPGALTRFLEILGTRWNITLFHYRTDGADYGRILTAFEAGPADAELTEHMDRLGYAYQEETDDPSARFFLAR